MNIITVVPEKDVYGVFRKSKMFKNSDNSENRNKMLAVLFHGSFVSQSIPIDPKYIEECL